MKGKWNFFKWLILIGGGLFIIIAGIWLLFTKLEGEEPWVQIKLSPPVIGASWNTSVSMSDMKSGMRGIWISLLKDGKEIVLLEKKFPANMVGIGEVKEDILTFQIKPKQKGITDGKAIIRMVARDFSWRDWGHGNKTYIEKPIMVDTMPPHIDVLTNAHNINQGGSGLVIYKLSEPSSKSGVHVGENYFPAYPAGEMIGAKDKKNLFMAFIAVRYDQSSDTSIFIEASDIAQNTGRVGFSHYIKKCTFKSDTLPVSEQFLNLKMPEFENAMNFPPDASLLDKFLLVNNKIRKRNYNQFIELTKQSDNTLYWKGEFLRFRGKRMASFADHRSYKYGDRIVDEQIHMGIDLASLTRSPVPAANTGKVAFSGYIGIYGNTVIIDHGLGLFSTYSHLSDFNVQKGEMVSKGDIIGRTGVTGLAGGDHLHFGMFVHNTFVNPVEWWDDHWIKDNVTDKIKLAASED